MPSPLLSNNYTLLLYNHVHGQTQFLIDKKKQFA